MAGSLDQLDQGSGGINWNSLLGKALDTYVSVETKQATIPDQTPVAATSPVQTAHQGGDASMTVPMKYLVLGGALLAALFLLKEA